MKPIAPADRKIANIHDAEYRSFVYPDGVALGDDILQLDPDLPLGEVLESFVGQFYDERTPPSLILTSEALPDSTLLAEAPQLRFVERLDNPPEFPDSQPDSALKALVFRRN